MIRVKLMDIEGKDKNLAEIFKVSIEKWSEGSEVKKYESITRKKLINFIGNFSKTIRLSQKGIEYLQNELNKQLLVNDEEFEGEMIFAFSDKECKYVQFFIDSNEENSFDLLANNLETTHLSTEFYF